jgi:hypothetical protein
MLSRTHLYTILSSPCLIHLILFTVQLPEISHFPPLHLRKLTLTAMFSWEALPLLIAQLATSLEYLELRWCSFPPLRELQLPSFPCLRELRHYQGFILRTFSDESVLTELFRVGSHITHLYLSGSFHHTRIAAFPESLQHLFIEDETVLTEDIFGTNSFPQLTSLSLHCSLLNYLSDPLTLPSFIRDHFPGITSLQLNIPWLLRNFALGMARLHPNVRALELFLDTKFGLDDEPGSIFFRCHVETPIRQLRQIVSPAALQTLNVEIIQTRYQFERSMEPCTLWINDTIIPLVTGLGGPNLKDIDLQVIQPGGKRARERMLCKRWVKLPNDDWQVMG